MFQLKDIKQAIYFNLSRHSNITIPTPHGSILAINLHHWLIHTSKPLDMFNGPSFVSATSYLLYWLIVPYTHSKTSKWPHIYLVLFEMYEMWDMYTLSIPPRVREVIGTKVHHFHIQFPSTLNRLHCRCLCLSLAFNDTNITKRTNDVLKQLWLIANCRSNEYLHNMSKPIK